MPKFIAIIAAAISLTTAQFCPSFESAIRIYLVGMSNILLAIFFAIEEREDNP